MSAFVVGKPHIDAMLTAGLRTAPHSDVGLAWYHNGITQRLDYTNADEVGAMLIAENMKSVGARYPGDTVETMPGPIDKSSLVDYRFDELPGRAWINPVTMLSALSCYEYQSCEHPEWPESEAHAFCDALRGRMIRLLPGYEDAPWEITDRNIFTDQPRRS